MDLKFNIEELINAVTNNDWTYISNFIPDKIYKYRTFKEIYNVINIEENKIKLTNPKNFNDPYDSALSYYVPFNIPANSEDLKHWLGSEQNNFSDETLPYLNRLSNGETIENVMIEMFASKGIKKDEAISLCKELEEFTSSYITDYVNAKFTDSSLRICSFTTRKDNLLMWNHYADEHRGFCIEYDISDIKKSFDFCRHLYPVIYSNELFKPQKYNFKQEELWAQELVASLFKSKDWAYEDEWRFVEAGGIGSEFYKMQKPSAIYFGTRYKDNKEENKASVDKLIQVADKLKIDKYKMKLSNQEFKMIADPFS